MCRPGELARMIGVSLTIAHENCPLAAATRRRGVRFSTATWYCDPRTGRWEKRMRATAPSGDALASGLARVRDSDGTLEFALRSKTGRTASFDAVFEGGEATDVVLAHDGVTIGPSSQADGLERWHLGFGTRERADDAIRALAAHRSLSVRERRFVDLAGFGPLLEHARAVDGFLAACRRLTPVERATLETAVRNGYYETPREESLASLGARLGVSDVAVSKTLRRAERKLLGSAVTALDDFDAADR